MSNVLKRSADHQRVVEELRRSSAAQPHRNKKRYTRKAKHVPVYI